jgi:hypothetical protein
MAGNGHLLCTAPEQVHNPAARKAAENSRDSLKSSFFSMP